MCADGLTVKRDGIVASLFSIIRTDFKPADITPHINYAKIRSKYFCASAIKSKSLFFIEKVGYVLRDKIVC
jgi:hypothetical protein